MATATPIRLTQPRVSALILEGTGAVVSVVLVLWLLLWFAYQTAQKSHVEAYFVAADDVPLEEVPFQAADVRRFRGAGAPGELHATGRGELAPEVLKAVGTAGNPLVVYISAPSLGRGTKAAGDPIRDLIAAVAKEAQRDVVLALDLAQIDTDRDLGVFGNSPYSPLEEPIPKPDKPSSHRIFVMTSAAPAQKSWSADGLGQSIFAYYLGAGLEGKATDWDPARRGAITAEGLHRYVLSQVRRWAWSRRDAVQTPMLLPVLTERGEASRVILRPIDKDASARPPTSVASVDVKPAAPAGEKSEAKEKAGPGATEEKKPEPPSEPATDAGGSTVAALFKEWQVHDDLRNKSPYPYRSSPGTWRSYEAYLLRAERRVRAARRDPSFWKDRAEAAVKEARERGAQLKQDLESREKDAKAFPFRPVRDDPQGRQELAAALKHLQVRLPDWLELADAQAADPRAGPDKGAAKNRLPPAFTIDASEAPSTFLELQLPNWAYHFKQEFECPDYFRDQGREAVFVRLLELRSQAELALAADRRGLPWIRSSIDQGDAGRRRLQDRLFGMPGNSGPTAEQEAQFNGVGRAYGAARDAIQKFHDAREEWERAADQLPYLAEWAIGNEARGKGERNAGGAPPLPGNQLPASVDGAVKAIEKLAQALGQPPAEAQGDEVAVATSSEQRLQRLADATKAVRDAVRALKDHFDRSTAAYGTDHAGWVELDAALRVPLIPARDRQQLLNRLLALEDSILDGEKTSAEAEADSPPDRGFWIRAAGLARLDLDLRRLGRGVPAPDEAERAIVNAWDAVRPSPEDRAAAQKALSHFAEFNLAIAETRRAVRSRFLEPSADDAARELGEVEKDLRGKDGEARYLAAREVDRIDPASSKVDRPVRDYAALADCACLEFHLARLREDYVGDRSLRRLADQDDSLKKSLGIRLPPPEATGGAELKVDVLPSGPRVIGPNWKTDFRVVVAPPGEGNGERGRRRVPAGSAFVGLIGLKEGLEIDGQPPGPDVLGKAVAVPLRQRTEMAFNIEQKKPVVQTPQGTNVLNLGAKVFYRGRFDLGPPVQIAIQPNRVDKPVVVQISQDPEWLRDKYPDYFKQIQDQFQKHEKRGYLRRGKDLHYILEVENYTPQPLNLSYRISLIDDAGKDGDELKNGEDVFPPGKSLIHRGTITAASVAGGKRPELRVELFEKGKPIIDQPYKVRFQEAALTSYMDITAKYDFFNPMKADQQPGEYFVVLMKRRMDDPVTEPIATKDLRCIFVEGAGRASTLVASEDDKGLHWVWPGRESYFYLPMPGRNRPIKFSADVENCHVDEKEYP